MIQPSVMLVEDSLEAHRLLVAAAPMDGLESEVPAGKLRRPVLPSKASTLFRGRSELSFVEC
jgi:hypothetical protein